MLSPAKTKILSVPASQIARMVASGEMQRALAKRGEVLLRPSDVHPHFAPSLAIDLVQRWLVDPTLPAAEPHSHCYGAPAGTGGMPFPEVTAFACVPSGDDCNNPIPLAPRTVNSDRVWHALPAPMREKLEEEGVLCRRVLLRCVLERRAVMAAILVCQ
jgi:hypothetical protein